MGIKESFKKPYLFIVGIIFVFIFVGIISTASAQLVDPSPISGETTGSKDTPYESAEITVTQTSYADPYNHRNFNDPPPVVGGSVYYLPPGVPDDGGRIHSNYTENTDSCAACHFTHTALGPRLLQWPSIYKACLACHDGTMGNYTYDVISGLIKQGPERYRTSGGLFGDIIQIASSIDLSNHMPDGTVLISAPAAPGGNPVVDETETLGCISCHTPHGQGGNARILNPDPNKLLFKKAKANPNDYVKWLTHMGGNVYQRIEQGKPVQNWIPGYPYHQLTKVMIGPAGLNVFWDQGLLKMTGGSFLDPEDYNIDFREGKVTLTATGVTKKGGDEVFAMYVPGIYVVMEIDNYLKSNEQVTYLAKDKHNRPTSINKFCEACHYDYNTEHFNEQNPSVNPRTGILEPYGSANDNSGKYSEAYRHQVGNKWVYQDWGREPTPSVIKFSLDGETRIITCLTCHVAHGVDQEYWKDTNDSYLLTAQLVEINPSSALKRLPNMAVCEACHQMRYANEGYPGPDES